MEGKMRFSETNRARDRSGGEEVVVAPKLSKPEFGQETGDFCLECVQFAASADEVGEVAKGQITEQMATDWVCWDIYTYIYEQSAPLNTSLLNSALLNSALLNSRLSRTSELTVSESHVRRNLRPPKPPQSPVEA